MRIANEISSLAAILACALATGCGGGDTTEGVTVQLTRIPQAAQAEDTAPEHSASPAAPAVDLTGRPSWDKGEESCDACTRGAGVMQPSSQLPRG